MSSLQKTFTPLYSLHAYSNQSLSGLIASIGSEEATILIDTPCQITTNLIPPSNISFKFVKGVTMTIDDTKWIEILGSVDAGPWQIFEFGGTNAWVKFGDGSRQTYSHVDWFGADPTGVSDSYWAIWRAIISRAGQAELGEQLNAVGGEVRFGKGTYRYGTPIVIEDLANIRFQGAGNRLYQDFKRAETRLIYTGTGGRYHGGAAGTAGTDSIPSSSQCGIYNTTNYGRGFQIKDMAILYDQIDFQGCLVYSDTPGFYCENVTFGDDSTDAGYGVGGVRKYTAFALVCLGGTEWPHFYRCSFDCAQRAVYVPRLGGMKCNGLFMDQCVVYTVNTAGIDYAGVGNLGATFHRVTIDPVRYALAAQGATNMAYGMRIASNSFEVSNCVFAGSSSDYMPTEWAFYPYGRGSMRDCLFFTNWGGVLVSGSTLDVASNEIWAQNPVNIMSGGWFGGNNRYRQVNDHANVSCRRAITIASGQDVGVYGGSIDFVQTSPDDFYGTGGTNPFHWDIYVGRIASSNLDNINGKITYNPKLSNSYFGVNDVTGAMEIVPINANRFQEIEGDTVLTSGDIYRFNGGIWRINVAASGHCFVQLPSGKAGYELSFFNLNGCNVTLLASGWNRGGFDDRIWASGTNTTVGNPALVHRPGTRMSTCHLRCHGASDYYPRWVLTSAIGGWAPSEKTAFNGNLTPGY